LRSVVLYGSGADGQLRPTSDVNLLLLLANFDQTRADRLREPLRLAQAAIRLTAMFILEEELRPAVGAFAVKFADIGRRRRVLYGRDPFAEIEISRTDAIARLRQTLLNLTLRMRESYLARSLREEQLIPLIADAAGPLRSCAATLLELEGKSFDSPRAAPERIAAETFGETEAATLLSRLTASRTERALDPGQAPPTFFGLSQLAREMWKRAQTLG
jgi:predicted nucleotidyltransferase